MQGRQIGAVVLNGSPTGLSALRSLAGHGIPTALIQTKWNHIAAHSRYARETHNVFEFQSGPSPLMELLERQAGRWRGRVLIPSSDRTVAFLARNRERLSRDYRVATPPWEITRTVLSKACTYKVAREVGIDTPVDYGPADRTTAARSDIAFPVIVKPVMSHEFTAVFGQKLFVAEDHTALLRAIEQLEGTGLEARVLDLIPGPDDRFFNYTCFLDERGNPVAEMGAHKLRKSPPHFGVGRMAEPADVEELREPTLELLRRMRWSGPASAEYKLDARTGRYQLMEVNGRLILMGGLAVRLGVDYPLLTWADAAGVKIPPQQRNGWNGVWLDLRAEIVYSLLLRGMEGRNWRETFAPYRRPKTFAVWSRRDPAPFLAAMVQLGRTGARALRARGAKGTALQLQASVPAH